MKRPALYLIVSLIMTIFSASLYAQYRPTTGFVLRGSYWDATEGDGLIRVDESDRRSQVELNGAGVSFGFFTKLSDQLHVEFSISSLVDGTSDRFINGREVFEAEVLVPIVLGLRMYLLPSYSKSGLQPYLSGGAGAYWLGDIHSQDDGYFRDEETVVYSDTRTGGYLGGGTNLHISRNFAFNFDARYHMVDFEGSSYQNSWEGGVGLSIMWGRR